ncbi:hypothetical protein HPB48_009565 [Haemaphysalis longicornis]|uniref:Uncharacterized protein n=1 Tax=Haemaphysalis longicornis TaxID=44386 RepID=A0A9J6G0R3_HAELO|nr:hypothetical protein HPB48_009565 [Haemaphysalis longicornis]
MGDSSRELPFLALKELATRLDRDIADASNHLAAPKTHSPASGVQIFERAETTAGELQLMKTRIDIVVYQQTADLEDLKQYQRHVDWENEETLKKLIPRGFRVPESLLPTLGRRFGVLRLHCSKLSVTAVSAYFFFARQTISTVCVFSAVEHLSLPGPIHSRTRLEKYLARIGCENTEELTQGNPPLHAMKTAVKFPLASSTPMTGAMAPLPLEEPSTVMRFSAPIYGIREESMSGIQTPELKELPSTPVRLKSSSLRTLHASYFKIYNTLLLMDYEN